MPTHSENCGSRWRNRKEWKRYMRRAGYSHEEINRQWPVKGGA